MASVAHSEAEAKLRRVCHVRHEYPGREWKREDSLLAFVYDVPDLDAYGVFTPLHLLNQRLLAGGSRGGMSPGATWEPFALSQSEYDDLRQAVLSVPPKALRRRARYAGLPYKFDESFDHLQDYYAWMIAVCAKHREAWQAELRRAGPMR
jgi:hypothetical protein